MNYFEKVSKFADIDLPMPVRATRAAAGYDFVVAEDVIIPPYEEQLCRLGEYRANYREYQDTYTLSEMATLTKNAKAKPALVSTGMKCYLEPGYYLELSVRSSTPLKHWLILANGVGIIDADYCDNPDNEGEIFFQLINLSPYPIQLKRGDKIGQGIIKRYHTTDNDSEQEKAERAGGFGSTSAAAPVMRGLHAQTGAIDDAFVDKYNSIGTVYPLTSDEIKTSMQRLADAQSFLPSVEEAIKSLEASMSSMLNRGGTL